MEEFLRLMNDLIFTSCADFIEDQKIAKRIGFACKYLHPDQTQKPKVLAKFHEQVKMYQPLLDKIQPSLFDILWDGDHKKNKAAIEPTIHPNFIDGHAHVKEHYEFACKTFDYPFDQQPIEQCYESWYEHIQDVYKNVDQPTLYMELVAKGLTKDVDFYGTPFSLI